jgi:hypothetical protein
LPQATIKLQPAPAPAAALRKPAQPVASIAALSAAGAKEDHKSLVTDDEEEENAAEDLPLPFAIAAITLALAALGIQVWTLYS